MADNAFRPGRFSLEKLLIGLLALIALVVFFGAWYTVGSDQRALLFTYGRIAGVQQPGLHIKWPLIQSVVKVDIRTQHGEAPAPAGTYDLQSVQTRVQVNYHYDAGKLPDIYMRTGLDVDAGIVAPRIQETVKAIVAHFNAEQLLKDREHVRQQIVDLLKAKLAAYDLVLEDIQLTDFKFDQSFEQAIEAKQVAEQQALTEKNNLQKAEILAQQKVASAQGEANAQLAIAKANAEAIRLQGDALRANPAYLELKKLDKWDGSLPHYVGSGADHVLIGIDGAK